MPHHAAPRASPPRRIRSINAPYSLARAVEDFERKYIENVIRLADGNLDEAAALLGLAPQEIRDLVAPQTQQPALAERPTS